VGYKSRRRWDWFWLAGGVAVIALGAYCGACSGDTERIGAYWATAAVDAEGVAQITEVIDYDFGSRQRRGIFRDVPDLDLDAPITVFSPTAPDPVSVEPWGRDTRIRIGNPDITITNRHRYQIEYPIPVGFDGNRISWNAVGSDWQVGMNNIEVHLSAANELIDPQCSIGETGSWDPCTVTQSTPGLLSVVVDDLGSFEGVTISAQRGSALSAAPALPTTPNGPAEDPGTGKLPPAGAALGAALIAAALGSFLVQRAGREWVWAGGSADAAFGPQFGEEYPVRRVDHAELDRLASTEFAPPKGLTAWQGGVLHCEAVSRDHQTAWLLEQAIDGAIELEGIGKRMTMRMGRVDTPDLDLLRALFGHRSEVALGSYDEQFAGGWKSLDRSLNQWYRNSHYWDPRGERRRTGTLGVAAALGLMGVVGLITFSVMANRVGSTALPGVAVCGLVTGAALAMAVRSWELRIRTPEGSGLWILIESFRRFINKSDAQHVEAAAEQGRLLEYTAWAVALGEVDSWTRAINHAEQAGTVIAPNIRQITRVAPSLGSATSSAATKPSSSGGSGGGGSVGGGGGGGGGGSW
jgi:uncharacterized membrane protein YgcG